nr:cytochrome P450 [Pharsalia antennata]
MLLTSSWLIDILLIIFTFIFVLYKYSSRNYDYWKKKGVYYLKPKPFIGNLYDVVTFKITMGIWQQKVYNSTDEPFVGMFAFHKPVLMIRSPELIKYVMVKNFDNFVNRSILAPDHSQVFANILFLSKSENWKMLRSKVTPAFTSSKLKAMCPIIKKIGLELDQYIKTNQGELEAKKLATKYSTEVISRTAFGLNGNCFDGDGSRIQKVGESMFEFSWKTAISQSAYFFMHGLVKFFRLEFVDRNAIDYLRTVFWQTIERREKENIKGNDLIDIIVELRKNAEFCNTVKFVGDKVVAQPVMYFAAGVETTSQTISYALYELCIHQEIQNKLREEILDYLKENQEITYDNLKELKYLEMCIQETLRKYPPLPFLDRMCNADFTIPGTDIVIDKGTPVYIPLMGLHYDKKYFPEPQKFNPERFADKSLYNQSGFCFLPFGEGPRMCLGERFAMMNVKIALINILSQFIVEPIPATPVPVRFTQKSFTLNSDVGLPMRFVEYVQQN